VLVGTRKFDLQSGGVVVLPDSGGTTFVTPPTGNFNIGAFTFSAKLDRLDSITFPRHGYYARANIYASSGVLGADETYTRWDALLSAPVTFGRHTVEALVAGGGQIGPEEIPVYEQFGLGGFLKLSGLQRDQLRTDRFAFGRLIYRGRVADIPLFGGVQVGASLEAARLRPLVPIWRGEIVSGDLTVMAGSIFVGVDSPLGPLFLGFGYANRDNKAVYLFLGLP
jgi:NTE family protein